MRTKKLLAAFLLGAGLCFVPALGQGEVHEEWIENTIPYMNFRLLMARVDYIMENPTNFLDVRLFYDPDGIFGRELFPKIVDTKGKIFVMVADTRGTFSDKFSVFLLTEFTDELQIIYSFMKEVATDLHADIAAIFYGEGGIPLGYFYQGEYHLWEK